MGRVREWNLNRPWRLTIAGCALGYLLLAKPWREADESMALGVYTCSAAFMILALVPRRTRFWVAVCAALTVPVLTEIVVDVLHLSQ